MLFIIGQALAIYVCSCTLLSIYVTRSGKTNHFGQFQFLFVINKKNNINAISKLLKVPMVTMALVQTLCAKWLVFPDLVT